MYLDRKCSGRKISRSTLSWWREKQGKSSNSLCQETFSPSVEIALPDCHVGIDQLKVQEEENSLKDKVLNQVSLRVDIEGNQSGPIGSDGLDLMREK